MEEAIGVTHSLEILGISQLMRKGKEGANGIFDNYC